MSATVRRYARFRHFDGMLAVLARDAGVPGAQTVELREEYDGLKAGLGLEPSAYVPSNVSDTDARWLVYFYLVDAGGHPDLSALAAARPDLSAALPPRHGPPSSTRPTTVRPN